MTRKRYIKLMTALMCGIMKENPGLGKVLQNCRDLKIVNGYWQTGTPCKSYAEAWERVKSLRQQYGM